jgi:hypothetical protein
MAPYPDDSKCYSKQTIEQNQTVAALLNEKAGNIFEASRIVRVIKQRSSFIELLD